MPSNDKPVQLRMRWAPVALVTLLALVATVLSAVPGVDAQPAPAEVTHTTSCLAGNGRVDTLIVNQTSSAAEYRIEFVGLSARAFTVEPGDWWRMPITGRPDGDYSVVVKRSGAVISDQTVTVACDTDPPAVPGPEVEIFSTCRSGNGYVLFQFLNASDTAAAYVIEFEGVRNRSTTAAAYGQALRAVTGRPDNEYGVLIRSGSRVVHRGSVQVDCDEDVDPAVGLIEVRARGRDGSENLELRLNGDTVASYQSIGATYRTFTYEVPAPVVIEQLRVWFTNNDPDRDADIDWVEVDGQRFETEAETVYSQGVWTAATGCERGYKQSETLACNGWVEYQAAEGLAIGGEDPTPWLLVWSDEFDGTSLDANKWQAFGGNYGNPPRLQVYRTGQENMRVEDGRLVLRATHDPATDEWFSGMVTTNDARQPENPSWAQGNLGWQYGRFEIRARMPYARGLWPALWMRPVDDIYEGSWPHNGEIDILEWLGPQGSVPQAPTDSLISNIHFKGPDNINKQNREEVPVTQAYAEDWHVYALEWEEGAFRFFVDGQQVHEVTSWDSLQGYPAPFDQRFDIIINLQVGAWAGTPDPADYPAQMEVDWVRVYEPR